MISDCLSISLNSFMPLLEPILFDLIIYSYRLSSSEFTNTSGVYVGFAMVNKKLKTSNFKYVRYNRM